MRIPIFSLVVIVAAIGLEGGFDIRAASPTIFKVLDPVRPDETLLLFGAHVTPRATASGFRLEDHPVSGPPAKLVESPIGTPTSMQVLQATDLSAKVLIPKAWKPGIYAVRLRNADGTSPWLLANRPALWWQMSGVGGKASPGGEIRIFGLNLGPKPRIWLVTGNYRSELKITAVHGYDVIAKLPGDVPPGRCQIWLHNGFGGKAGFGEPLSIEMAPAEVWPAKVFDVRSFGAKGDNATDDTEAIRSALHQAEKNGGGIVYLPRGTYIVSGKLKMPRRTVLRGEAKDAVWLKVPRNAAPFDAVIAGDGQFSIEDLSMIATPVQRLIASPDDPDTFTQGWARWHKAAPKLGQISLRRLRLQHLTFSPRLSDGDPRRQIVEGPTAVAIRGPDCVVEGCVIVSSGYPLQLSAATRAHVAGNQFGTGRNGANGFSDLQDSVFEDNEVLGRDLEGTYGGVQGVAAHVMFRGNYWHDAYGCEREGLVFDTPYYPIWAGRAGSDGATIHFKKTETGHWPPQGEDADILLAGVIAGKGLGQMIPVKEDLRDGVRLERSLAVPLDSSSLVVIFVRKFQVIVADNRFADAAVAIQLYSQCSSFVMTGNRSERTGGGESISWDFVDRYQNRRISASYFNQWIDNKFFEGLTYYQPFFPEAFVGYTSLRKDGFTETTDAIGNRFIGNTLNSNTFMGGKLQPEPKAGTTPVSLDAIFENNSIRFSPVGIEVDPGHWYSLLRNNRMENVVAPYKDKGIHTIISPKN